MNHFFLYANIKYNSFYTYDKEKGIIYDNNGNSLPKIHILYKILEKYKDMISFLTDIKILPHTSMEEADNSLIYKGRDKKGKEQYKYGVNYIMNRDIEKLKTFLKVFNKMEQIQEVITNGLQEKTINKIFLFAVILLFELTFFIRLGKDIYLKDNETIGLLTLKKEHITINNIKKEMSIKFKGKTGKEQIFLCLESEQPILYKVLHKLYLATKNTSDFLFVDEKGNKFTERILNHKLAKYNLSLKDFRTYGVNITFIKNVFNQLQIIDDNNLNEKKIKKLLNDSITETANTIGHTKSVSKKSYLSQEICEIIENLINENKIKNDNFEKFMKKILNQTYKYLQDQK